MKKNVILIFVLALCLSLALTACTPSAPKQDDKGATQTTQNAEKTEEKEFVFVKDNVQMPMNAKAAEIIEKLGKPQSEFIAPTCAFQGDDKVFTYPGFQLNTYQDGEGNDYVLGVLFTDDSVATAEGLRLFDDISKVKELYGETEVKEGLYRYEKGNSILSIVDNNGKVYSIEYRAIINF